MALHLQKTNSRVIWQHPVHSDIILVQIKSLPPRPHIWVLNIMHNLHLMQLGGASLPTFAHYVQHLYMTAVSQWLLACYCVFTACKFCSSSNLQHNVRSHSPVTQTYHGIKKILYWRIPVELECSILQSILKLRKHPRQQVLNKCH